MSELGSQHINLEPLREIKHRQMDSRWKGMHTWDLEIRPAPRRSSVVNGVRLAWSSHESDNPELRSPTAVTSVSTP